ncbi:PH domain-containing protein [Alishewanella longhuensis]
MIEPDYVEGDSAPESLLTLQQWQRLSAIALFFFCLRLFKTVFGNIGYLAPTLLVFYQGMQRYPGYSALALAAISLLLIGVGILHYWVFRFRVIDDTVEIHSGILRKKQLNLPFSRIQNVRLLQPIYYRLSDHLCIVLDTAGSSQQEAQLAALPRVLAEQLQQAIYLAKAGQPAVVAAAEQQSTQAAVPAGEQLLCTRSVKDLVFYGISNNRVMLVLGLAAPFYKPITELVGQQLDALGLDVARWFNPDLQSWLWLGLAALALTMLLMLLITLLSIAASVLSYYQFQLWHVGDRYVRRSGLLTRHEISMKASRLQWLQLQQDWVDKLIGRCNVHYEQVHTPYSEYQEQAEHGKIMVPAVLPAAAARLLAEVYPDNQLANSVFGTVNWRYLVPVFAGFCLPLLLVSQYVFLPMQPVMAMASLLAIAMLVGLFLLRWRRFGYAMDANYLYIRQGVIGTDYYCVPLHKLQQLSIKQHWFMQKAGLKHLTLVFASGSLTIPYMPAAAAEAIANYALYRAESSNKGWM